MAQKTRHPYPGQQWKHGYIPLTYTAALKKAHGNKSYATKLSKAKRLGATRRRRKKRR